MKAPNCCFQILIFFTIHSKGCPIKCTKVRARTFSKCMWRLTNGAFTQPRLFFQEKNYYCKEREQRWQFKHVIVRIIFTFRCIFLSLTCNFVKIVSFPWYFCSILRPWKVSCQSCQHWISSGDRTGPYTSYDTICKKKKIFLNSFYQDLFLIQCPKKEWNIFVLGKRNGDYFFSLVSEALLK